MKKLFSLLIAFSTLLSLSALVCTPVAAAEMAQRAQGGGIAPRFVVKRLRENNRKMKYTIDVKYPQLAAASDPRAARFNREVSAMVMKGVTEFKKDFPLPADMNPPDMGSSYDVTYSVELATRDLVSLSFLVVTYSAGAAHPQHFSAVYNYDLARGRKLELGDLFKPNSNYLRVISDYCISALKRELGANADAEWINTGAGPKLENYGGWNVTRKGLEITFDAYQVASYAEGDHEVVIPYSTLKNISAPDGPLASVTTRGANTRR